MTQDIHDRTSPLVPGTMGGPDRAVHDPYGTEHGSTGVTTITGRHAGDVPAVALRDRVRWGPVFAGVVVTLATFLLLQLAIVAADLFGDGGDAGTWLTAVAALVAFFVGGLTAGGTALWSRSSDGLVNAVVMWAVSLVGLLLLAVLGTGSLLGPLATAASDLVRLQDLSLQDVPQSDIDTALAGARDAAGWSLLGLSAALVAAAVGGLAGAGLWPRDARNRGRTTA